MSAFSEATTSRFAQVALGEQTLNIHYNDCGSGSEVVVMLHGSDRGPVVGPISTATSIPWSMRAIE